MATVMNCSVRFGRLCPLRREGLVPTADETVRRCETCWRLVFLWMTDTEAWYHAMEGHCVAMLMPNDTLLSVSQCRTAAPGSDGNSGRRWDVAADIPQARRLRQAVDREYRRAEPHDDCVSR